eukprot:COSAG02_NODE_4881_length_4866_cov_17.494860_6_plen_68_part_00
MLVSNVLEKNASELFRVGLLGLELAILTPVIRPYDRCHCCCSGWCSAATLVCRKRVVGVELTTANGN